MKRKILGLITSIAVSSFMLVGCSNKDVVIKDREGNEVKLPDKMERIISMAPSNTEILVGLGLGDKIVGIDQYSLDVEGIKQGIEEIQVPNPDAETIIGLDPDIIIASDHNKAGASDDPFKLVEEAGISVVYIPSSESIESIYEDINFIADITNTEEKGKEIVDSMKSQIDEVKAKAKNIKTKKKVYFEIGPSPNLYSFGNSTFLNEMIEIIGAENIFKDENGWTSPSAESIIDKNPDVILTNVNYIDNPVEEIKSREGWQDITAIKDNQGYLIDKNSSSRPSQHIIKALNEMAKAIYPDVYEK